MKPCNAAFAVVLAVLSGTGPARAATQAVEIGADQVGDLPGGREADGIIGDFVLRNDLVEIVVSANLHERRANIGTHWDAPTPGCVYDFTFRGTQNDQLTLWAPGAQKGQLSSVRIIKDGSDGEAVIRAELTAAAAPDGVARCHDYFLRDGWRYVVAVSTYENRSAKRVKFRPSPRWTGLRSEVKVGETLAGLCQDPDDRIGYASAPVEWPQAKPATSQEITLAPGKTARFAAALAIGAGPADAWGVLQTLGGKNGNVFSGHLTSTDGRPPTSAVLQFTVAGAESPLVAYVDTVGKYHVSLPESAYQVTVRDLGRDAVTVALKPEAVQTIALPPAAGVEVDVRDEAGAPLPCKVQFIGLNGTADPDLGPNMRAHGCDNQYHSENGRFSQALPPGGYRVVITHGIEYDHAEKEIVVEPGKTASVTAALKRVVDTAGWVSCDFHNHTTESGDNFCGTPDRVINLAAEQVEFAPTTEHNRIISWQPHIERLKLTAQIKTVSGLELTGGGPHLNAFPLTPVPRRQDGGAPKWSPDPRISALTLHNMPGDSAKRWVQFNHPNMERYFNDVDGDKKPDGGFAGVLQFVDAAEVYGQFILTGQRHWEREVRGKMVRRDNWPLLWLQMLNAGQRVWTVATSDAHEVTLGGVGGWRTYVSSSHDAPAEIDPNEIIAHAKRGDSFVTNGPFLQVATADGHGPGAMLTGIRRVVLKVRVQCNTWTDIDRVCVLINGRAGAGLDFRKSEHPEMFAKSSVRFEREIPVELKSDAHLIVVAIGEGSTLATGYGHSWQAKMLPVAYHNPIYVDVNSNGFEPNYDTLGHPYLDFGFAPGTTKPAE